MAITLYTLQYEIFLLHNGIFYGEILRAMLVRFHRLFSGRIHDNELLTNILYRIKNYCIFAVAILCA